MDARKSIFRSLALIGGLLGTASAASNDTGADQLRRGRELLQRAVEAVGGQHTLADVRNIRFRAEGETHNPYQGISATTIDAPGRDGAIAWTNIFDFAGGRYRQETVQDLHGGLVLKFGTIVAGGRVHGISFAENIVRSQAAAAA